MRERRVIFTFRFTFRTSARFARGYLVLVTAGVCTQLLESCDLFLQSSHLSIESSQHEKDSGRNTGRMIVLDRKEYDHRNNGKSFTFADLPHAPPPNKTKRFFGRNMSSAWVCSVLATGQMMCCVLQHLSIPLIPATSRLFLWEFFGGVKGSIKTQLCWVGPLWISPGLW